MPNTQDLINALVRGGYNITDATNAANGSNAGNLANEYLHTTVTNNLPPSTVAPGATSNAPLPTAPAGGFQQGGWYNGRQYWNGTFSQPGQIHPESNQQGAGQMVSPEILASTSIAAGNAPGANQAYINSQYANPSGGGASGLPGTAATGAAGAAGGANTVTGTGGLPSETETKYNELMATMNTKRAEADKRRAEVNENPFLSEASRVGRIAKIDAMLNDSLATDQIQLSALDKKRAAEAEANKPDLMITTETDNAGNVSILTIDKKTGKLISVTSGGKVGKADKPAGTSATETKAATQQAYRNEIQAAAAQGVTLEDLLKTYVALGVDPNDIYAIYNSSSSNGAARTEDRGVAGETVWTPTKLRQYGITVPAEKTTKTTTIDPKTGAITITE